MPPVPGSHFTGQRRDIGPTHLMRTQPSEKAVVRHRQIDGRFDAEGLGHIGPLAGQADCGGTSCLPGRDGRQDLGRLHRRTPAGSASPRAEREPRGPRARSAASITPLPSRQSISGCTLPAHPDRAVDLELGNGRLGERDSGNGGFAHEGEHVRMKWGSAVPAQIVDRDGVVRDGKRQDDVGYPS